MSRSAYYEWKQPKTGNRAAFNRKLEEKTREVYFEFKQRYGSPRIAKELNKVHRLKVSRPKVAKVMRQLGLRSKIGKKFVATTDSSHNYPVVDNLLDRNFTVDMPSRVWVSDITYIPTSQGFIYLTTILDLFDRKVIGYAISDGMTAQETTLEAWRVAIKNRRFDDSLIFHSDRGIQYACSAFSNTLDSYGVRRSMSRKGNCWDNAVAESFFKSLKAEEFHGQKLRTKYQTQLALFEYIELFYNTNRRHEALGNLTIQEFQIENDYLINVA